MLVKSETDEDYQKTGNHGEKAIELLSLELTETKKDILLKQQSIEALQMYAIEQRKSIQALEAQIAEKEKALAEIINSKAWMIALAFRRISSLLVQARRVFIQYIRLLPFRRKQTQLNKDLALIRSSGLFDEAWYLTNNPDVAKTKEDPLLHYLERGANESRDPNPYFSNDWYRKSIRNAKINPLLHYVRSGKKEGRKTQSDSQELAQYFSRTDLQEKNTQGIHLNPIIIHQMGKVGSKTVQLSLMRAYEALGIRVPICHSHTLAGFDERRQYALLHEQNIERTLAAVEHGEEIRKQIDENPSQHFNLITLVREPIARNIARFFHNLAEFIPDWHERYKAGKLNADELQKFFLSISRSQYDPSEWFQIQMKSVPAFGIDVFAEPFSKERGYKIYPGTSRARLLLIRMENLNDCSKDAMNEFLGIKNFTIHNTNVAEEKDYAALYRAFKNQPLPVEYVQKIYSTKVARHFYMDMELLSFAKRWTGMDHIELAN